jgi:hypothetical protein
MSYESALEAAGAEVLAFAQFGSYSGQWMAKVRYNGETGYIQDWYGSCSYCDAFEAEFYRSYDMTDEEYEKCLAEFGKRYLGTILSAQHYIDMYVKQDEQEYYLSDQDNEALDWIRYIEGLK